MTGKEEDAAPTYTTASQGAGDTLYLCNFR